MVFKFANMKHVKVWSLYILSCQDICIKLPLAFNPEENYDEALNMRQMTA